MPNKHRNPNAKLPNGLYGGNLTNTVKYVFRPVWSAIMGFMGNIIRYLCKKHDKPNKFVITNQPNQPNQPDRCAESIYQHPCPNNPIRTCNCSTPSECADSDFYTDTDRYKDGIYDRIKDRKHTEFQ